MTKFRYFGASLKVLAAAAVGFGGLYSASAAAQAALITPTFTAAQAKVGTALYDERCAACHGSNLANGELGPPLAGEAFLQKWGGRRTDELFEFVATKMPPTAAGSLTPEQTSTLLAYILQKNHIFASDRPLPVDLAALKGLSIPAPTNMFGELSVGITLPPPPNPAANPLDHITPVTEAMLRKPNEGDWLTWRRTPDDSGFSPLTQINKGNVSRLKPAWSWALPDGPNELTPIEHDGVLFAYASGDIVQALNAVTGDLLWQYVRRLPKGAQSSYKKSIAIYGGNVYMATSDMHMVALDMKTGDVKWDSPVVPDGAKGYHQSGGVVVAKGKVITGTAGGAPGGNFIVAFNAETGKEAWRFATIPHPGQPGGDSWNGLPMEKRNGSSVWNPGSYDPETGLVFFGPSPTYDTLPLLDPINNPKVNSDAAYTNDTVALNVDTGKLVWYFSHLPNDQWDLDWAFERQIINLPINGETKRVVITGGKEAIFDVMDVKTGKYEFSFERGLQDLVKSIDPKTGFKTIDREHISPGKGHTVSVCPHAEGGKNWIPDSYNPNSKVLFVPLVEACMDLVPAPPGEGGPMNTGSYLNLRPRAGSDGNFGRLDAINLETRQPVWVHRQRSASTTGALDTAGGVVFAGYMDRGFGAYDDATGEELWHTRLSDVPNSTPITYQVNGKQYIAIMTGNGGNQARIFARLTPEIKAPANHTSIISVFEVDEASPRGGH